MTDITIRDTIPGDISDEKIEVTFQGQEATLRDGLHFITLTHSAIDELYHKKEALIAAQRCYENGEHIK